MLLAWLDKKSFQLLNTVFRRKLPLPTLLITWQHVWFSNCQFKCSWRKTPRYVKCNLHSVFYLDFFVWRFRVFYQKFQTILSTSTGFKTFIRKTLWKQSILNFEFESFALVWFFVFFGRKWSGIQNILRELVSFLQGQNQECANFGKCLSK